MMAEETDHGNYRLTYWLNCLWCGKFEEIQCALN